MPCQTSLTHFRARSRPLSLSNHEYHRSCAITGIGTESFAKRQCSFPVECSSDPGIIDNEARNFLLVFDNRPFKRKQKWRIAGEVREGWEGATVWTGAFPAYPIRRYSTLEPLTLVPGETWGRLLSRLPGKTLAFVSDYRMKVYYAIIYACHDGCSSRVPFTWYPAVSCACTYM